MSSMSMYLVLSATVLIAISGVLPLLIGRRSPMGERISMLLNVAGAGLGIWGLIAFLSGHNSAIQLEHSWFLPFGRFAAGLDGLTVLFLFPIFLISGLGSIYGLEYWPVSQRPGNARKLRLFWGLMSAGMAIVVLARDGIFFLIGWEIMALSAFFLVSTEDTRSDARKAGWVYIVATHVGTLTLFALFALLRKINGSFALWVSPAELSSAQASAVFILALIGFGMKAGIMPLHIWLPGAHANAPSHVSAILSGVLLKTGVYGIIRVSALSPNPPLWWGVTLLVIGGVSGILAIAFSLAQHDFKRMLAYSSIENIGIIMIGIGLALVGRFAQRPEWVLLGMGGAFLHVLNHSLFKPLLFMGAGSILHATHTRKLDRLGGLGKKMPRTYFLFTVGALAICGLPPLNGFVSELLIYVGLLQTALGDNCGSCIWVLLAAPALAMIGALAVAAFVKLIGAVFAGTPRTACAEHAHEAGLAMLAPMATLAICCAMIGLWPMLLIPLLERAVSACSPAPVTISLASQLNLCWISILGLFLVGLSLALYLIIRRRSSRSPAVGTWDCGYSLPTPRIQYSGSSFAQMLTDIFSWALFTRKRRVQERAPFPEPSQFHSETPDTVLDRVVLPSFSLGRQLALAGRILQGGSVQIYVLYVLAAMLVLMLFSM